MEWAPARAAALTLMAPLTPPHMPPFMARQWLTWSRTEWIDLLERIHSSIAKRSRALSRESESRTMYLHTKDSPGQEADGPGISLSPSLLS
jgi:hypothetical protein